MRKELQREVTHTVIKSVTTMIVGGKPSIYENEDIIEIGNVQEHRAIKLAVKKFGTGTTVVSVEPNTKKYVMSLDTFLEHATEVVPESEEA